MLNLALRDYFARMMEQCFRPDFSDPRDPLWRREHTSAALVAVCATGASAGMTLSAGRRFLIRGKIEYRHARLGQDIDEP